MIWVQAQGAVDSNLGQGTIAVSVCDNGKHCADFRGSRVRVGSGLRCADQSCDLR